jgi:hypothetical protein
MPGSGADLEYQRLLNKEGVDPASAQGKDAALLEQMADTIDGPLYGDFARLWVLGVHSDPPTALIPSCKWLIQLNFGDTVPSWVPVGSWILRK